MQNKCWIRSKHRPSVQEAYLKLVHFEKTLKVISDLIQVLKDSSSSMISAGKNRLYSCHTERTLKIKQGYEL